MPTDKRIYSSDETPTPHRVSQNPERDVATESLTTSKKFMNKATENRVLITLWIAIIIGVGIQLLSARDSTHQQPLVDSHQDFRIELNTSSIDKMVKKLDQILERLPPK